MAKFIIICNGFSFYIERHQYLLALTIAAPAPARAAVQDKPKSAASSATKATKISTALCAETEALLSDVAAGGVALPSQEFRDKMTAAMTELTGLCEKWQELQVTLPAEKEDVSGAVCAVIGMATLLVKDKLKQVRIFFQLVAIIPIEAALVIY